MITPAYRILTIKGHTGLLCMVCNRISYNWNDIREHYCGACHRWLDDKVPEDLRWGLTQNMLAGVEVPHA